MRTRTPLITLLLVVSLLLAPASLAGPSGDAGFGWFSQVKAFVVDVLDFFSFGGPDQSYAPADQGDLKAQPSSVCDPSEMGAGADPGGC